MTNTELSPFELEPTLKIFFGPAIGLFLCFKFLNTVYYSLRQSIIIWEWSEYLIMKQLKKFNNNNQYASYSNLKTGLNQSFLELATYFLKISLLLNLLKIYFILVFSSYLKSYCQLQRPVSHCGDSKSQEISPLKAEWNCKS